jgi:hypothetical protein
MKPILASSTTMSVYPLESYHHKIPITKEVNNVIPIIAINDIVNNKSIMSYKVKELIDKKDLIDYIKYKISLIDKMHLNLIREGSFGAETIKVILSGASILKKNMNLSENCAIVSSALFEHFTDPKSQAFLGEDFNIKLVGIDECLSCYIFKNSNDLTENQEITVVIHCYLIIEHNLLNSQIIVDPTISNYRSDQNMFIGSTVDLLQSLLELITNKKQYYKGKLPSIQTSLDLNKFLYSGTGSARKLAVAFKHAWYGGEAFNISFKV